MRSNACHGVTSGSLEDENSRQGHEGTVQYTHARSELLVNYVEFIVVDFHQGREYPAQYGECKKGGLEEGVRKLLRYYGWAGTPDSHVPRTHSSEMAMMPI